MKKLMMLLLLAGAGLATFACTGKAEQRQEQTAEAAKTDSVATGEVIQMDKAMFLERVCNYEQKNEWKYLGDKPAIIDLYADWCGPCRRVAPILKELAKEYADSIVIYKVNVDKERELAALFGASSIPLFVFIPMDEAPQLLPGAVTKEVYQKIINEFLLKKPAQ